MTLAVKVALNPNTTNLPIMKFEIVNCKLFVLEASFIDCMVFNTVFNSISVTSQWLVHLSMFSWSSFNQYSTQYSFQATGCFPTKPLSKQWRAVSGMNSVAMTIINPLKEYWQSSGLNQRPPVLKSATLPTELWGAVDASLEKGLSQPF